MWIITAVLTIFALRPLPSTILLVALVGLLRGETQWVIPRPYALLRLASLLSAVFIGCYISYSIAGSTTVTSREPTLLYSGVFSLLGLVPLIPPAILRRGGFEFPLIWASWWWLVTTISPVGRLGIWSPLSNDNPYEWTRPFFGEYGIDWMIGGWVEVCSSFSISLLMGVGPRVDGDKDTEEGPSSSSLRPRIPDKWSQSQLLALVLLTLAIPSVFINPLPDALHGGDRRDVGVACVLPPPSNDSYAFDNFWRETRTVIGHAHIVLWPEGAVGFNSVEDRERKLDIIRLDANMTGSYIGVSFTEPEVQDDGSRTGKWRNGIAIVSSEGVIFEYYKRKFIPSVDSIPQVGGHLPPPTVTINLGSVSKPMHRWNLTLSASIGPDFAHPIAGMETRPTLILGPARTWQVNAGRVMMEMARHRAEELGTTVLWCDDGEAGLSGLVGNGQSGVQVGYGSLVKRISVRLPRNETRTLYGYAGCWIGFLAAWLPVFILNFSLPRFLALVERTMRRIRDWVRMRLRRRVRHPRANLIDDNENIA
ncbi:hypothetical protein FRC17_010274 [Serendipita sp. 399]|nr:hypothetical protein FRC17_010274 [Serendipita sp. 399]